MSTYARKEKKKRSVAGFTLGELMTSVAIISILASLTIPQYLRFRMETNMEMVRQHMRIVAEKMVEILGRENRFPTADEWMGWVTGNPIDTMNDDELTITASLGAIDDYCYTTGDYMVNDSGSQYRFCSAPQSGACGRNAGYKRFCVHYHGDMASMFAAGSVGEVELWEGAGTNAHVWNTNWNAPTMGLTWLSNTPDLTLEEKSVFWADYLERTAIFVDWKKNQALALCGASCPADYYYPPTMQLEFPAELRDGFNVMIPEVYRILQERGIEMSVDDAGSPIPSESWINLGYTLEDPVENLQEYTERLTTIDPLPW